MSRSAGTRKGNKGVSAQRYPDTTNVNPREPATCLVFLIAFFDTIRPGTDRKRRDPHVNLADAMVELRRNPALLQTLRTAMLATLVHSSLKNALLYSGIPLARGFWQELLSRLKHKLLPPLQEEEDFLYVIDQIFYRKNDYLWVEEIYRSEWIAFFDLIEIPLTENEAILGKHLVNTLKTLSLQVAQLGLENEISGSIGYHGETDGYGNYTLQHDLIRQLEADLQGLPGKQALAMRIPEITGTLNNIREQIDRIRTMQSTHGAGLTQTYLMLLLENRIRRMLLLLDGLDQNNEFQTGRLVDFLVILIRNENRKTSLRELMSQGAGFLAYQIAEQKGKKGNKYITTTVREYFSMVRSAMWGGFIISFVAVAKNFLNAISMPPFWHGLAFSVNYAAGFVCIEETKSTLATKQPAFTASAVAGSMDIRKEGNVDFHRLSVTVARVSRSQIASFVGNLVVVFPLTFFLAWLFHTLTGEKIAEGAAAWKLLQNQHPWNSLAILYACNTGVFLFLSGIIAGYVQNMVKYDRVRARIIRHPGLSRILSAKRREKLSGYVDEHAGALAGNIALGFFLGMSAVAQAILGIPFDIRHITISAGNTAVGLYGIGIGNVPPAYLVAVLAGVLAIGFFNFLVSFTLAFFVALKSRGIRLNEYPQFLKTLWRFFKKYPFDFVRPPAIPR